MSNLSTFKVPLISGPAGTHGSSSASAILTLDSKGHLSVGGSAPLAGILSAFTNDAGFVTQTGVRNAISAAGALSYNAATGVVSLSFDPSLKMDKAGGTFSGPVYFNGLGTNGFEIGNGDGANYASYNIKLRSHNGLALATYDGTVTGLWDSRAGVLDTKGGFTANGKAVWHAGNFDPATKVNKAGDTLTGQLVAKAGVGGAITSRTGDGSHLQVRADEGQGAAAMTFHRSNSYATWFGLDTDNEFKFGGWSEGAATYRFWTSKNFNPASYAALNTSPRFTNVYLGASDALLYTDSTNIRFRSGTAASGYKYAGLNDDGTFQTFNGGFESAGDVHAAGAVRANGRVVVGEGQANSYIEMRDTDEGTRYFHNNGGTIGTLGNDGNWKLRVYDTGAVWTAQIGDLNTRIETRAAAFADDRAGYRVAKTGDTMTGDLQITKSYPMTRYLYPGVRDLAWMLRENGGMYLWDYTANNWNIFIGPSGEVSTRQLGDLNSRIEGRASAYANERVAKTGDTMSGNLSIQPGSYPSVNMLYPNVKWWGMQIRENGWLYFPEDNLATFNIALVPGGNIWSRAFGGYLTDYITNRINALAGTVQDIRMVYAGDLNSNWNRDVGNFAEPYGGAAITTLNWYNSGGIGDHVGGARWRYIQKQIGGNWYTVAYA